MKRKEFLLLVVAILTTVAIFCCGEENPAGTQENPQTISEVNSVKYLVSLNEFSAGEMYGYLAGTQLFSLDMKFLPELENIWQNQEISAELRHEFSRQGYPLAGDAVFSKSSSRPYWVIYGTDKRYRIKEQSGENGGLYLRVYDVYAVFFRLAITVENRSSKELLMSDVIFSIEDRDTSAVYHDYPIESMSLPVKILSGGKWSGNLSVVVEPQGEYKLVVTFGNEQVIMDLPLYEFDREGSFDWSVL